MSTAEPITVIAAACNEAEHAPRWLEHLDFATRVVVVDTGSRDGTPDILESGGAHVERLEQSGAYLIHAAKNRALAHVEDGWVLDLDLDERVTLPLVEELRAVCRDGSPFRGYTIPFEHYAFGRYLRYGGWRGRHLRFYRAGALRYPEDRAHSTPLVDGRVGELEASVIHFAQTSIHDFLVKMNRYTSQDAPLMLEHGRGGLRNRPPLAPGRLRWLRQSLGVFWNRYVKAAGFRDGVAGLVAAALLAAYVFVEQAKVWEAQHVEDGAGGDS